MDLHTYFHKTAIGVLLLLANTPIAGSELTSAKPEVWINVFVHGIISIKPYITVTNIMRFLNDTIGDSVYAETVELIRNDPFFYQNQTIQERGLVPIDIKKIEKGAAASLMGAIFESTSVIANPSIKNYYYTFGWSGLLSRTARYNDAKFFLEQLEKEVEQFRAQGIQPKIRLLGYSHGGTIVLKLALVKQQEERTPSFSVDEALIFGTPIQYDTDHLIADPLFKKVYNIFSRSDRVQKLDFFSCGEFFSAHEFRSHGDFTLPDKLTQIEIRVIRKKGEARRPFDTRPHHTLYDGLHCSRNYRNVSPGHTELWFFGWTPLNYRPTFPLYPLPLAAFTPYILQAIKPYESSFTPDKPLVITLDARRDSMILKNNNCIKPAFLPFIGQNELIKLKQKALLYKPDADKYNLELFNEHLARAFSKAERILRAKKCKHHTYHHIR